MAAGYQALRRGAGWFDVSRRGRIRAAGDDRLRLLHALATNSIESLSPGQGTETFFLSAQGRIQARVRVYVSDQEVLLETDQERTQTLLDYLSRFIIMDDVTLAEISQQAAAVAVEGPEAPKAAAQALGAEVPAAPHGHLAHGDIQIFHSALTGDEGLWIAAPPARRQELIAALEQAGAVAAEEADVHAARVANLRPQFGVDYFDTNIPQETQQLDIVSFRKGCYIGQEIVERVRSQGQVNKLLTPLRIDGNKIPESAAVMFEGKAVGEATSLALLPDKGAVGGFAIVRRAAATPGAEVEVGGRPARVLAWPAERTFISAPPAAATP